jgi:methylenetetrahydrofolate dehydrogenase (NADP+)/methenyltetrahydrofolate cyclohydrolase
MSEEPRQTIVVDGLALSNDIRDELAEAVARHVSAGRRPPRLAVVLVGDDPASASYIKGKQRACTRVGMDSEEHDLPATASQEEAVKLVESLNAEDGVDGILVQLPLPKGMDANVTRPRTWTGCTRSTPGGCCSACPA